MSLSHKGPTQALTGGGDVGGQVGKDALTISVLHASRFSKPALLLSTLGVLVTLLPGYPSVQFLGPTEVFLTMPVDIMWPFLLPMNLVQGILSPKHSQSVFLHKCQSNGQWHWTTIIT